MLIECSLPNQGVIAKPIAMGWDGMGCGNLHGLNERAGDCHVAANAQTHSLLLAIHPDWANGVIKLLNRIVAVQECDPSAMLRINCHAIVQLNEEP